MIDYFDEHDGDDAQHPGWMPLFISLMLVLLTVFIFLTTFATGSKKKVEAFRKEFRKSLMISGEGGKGRRSLTSAGTMSNPVRTLLNRMKSNGINKKLMDDFLTVRQIKDLQVREGQNGVAVILPEVIGFAPGTDQLTPRSKTFLEDIALLAYELTYLVEIKGYSTTDVPNQYRDPLEFSARRAMRVYQYLINKDVPAVKLKVSGCGDTFANSDVPQDKVEIIFKTEDL